jgi:predicted RNA-binding Zn-ribbon protein involved in translation (DUF1610 family)
MLTINDRLEEWEINTYEKARLAEGNHRVFNATEKSFICPRCGRVVTFYIGSSLDWCVKCKEDIPQADLLLTMGYYRVKYHFGKEGQDD